MPNVSQGRLPQFLEYHSPTWAAKFLYDWCQQVMRFPRIEPLKNRQACSCIAD